jgi:hypothetical protein
VPALTRRSRVSGFVEGLLWSSGFLRALVAAAYAAAIAVLLRALLHLSTEATLTIAVVAVFVTFAVLKGSQAGGPTDHRDELR